MKCITTPWSERAAQLKETEGPYCDYAAFCEWLDAWNERQSEAMQLDTEQLDMTALYTAFLAAITDEKK